MSQLTKVLGFYYKIGSTDYPFNANPNENFGFDVNGGIVSTTPVFSYSINDVEKSFNTVRELRQQSVYTSSTDGNSTPVNSLLVESANLGVGYDYSAVASESVATSSFWRDAFKIIEFLYDNQATAKSSDNTWGSFNQGINPTYGADMLGESKLADRSDNPYYVKNFQKNSLVFSYTQGSWRINMVSFSLDGGPNGIVQFQIYFSPDSFISRGGATGNKSTYKVYKYEDPENDTTISDDNFTEAIIDPVFNILKEGRYKTYNVLKVDKRESDTVYTTEQFYVFGTTSSAITAEIMREQVINYLREAYIETGVESESWLRYTYPTLFTENVIYLIPIWDNQITTASGATKDIHPVNIDNIASALNKFGYSITDMDGSVGNKHPTELFYVGPGAGWMPSVEVPFIIPILAVEESLSSGITNPVSSRFPGFVPIYGQDLNGDAAEFHFILLMLLNVIQGKSSIDDSFQSEYGVSQFVEAGSTIKQISFTFSGNTWILKGPDGSGISS